MDLRRRGGKGIHASTDSGEVRFAQGRMGEACVVVRKRVKAQSRAEAEELMGQVQVDVLRDGDTIRVDRGHVRAPKGQSIEVSYVIEGPVNADLDLSSVNGHIEVVGSEAAVRGQSTNGNVTVRDVSGPVQLRTQNGNISARIKRLVKKAYWARIMAMFYVRVAEGNGSLTASFDKRRHRGACSAGFCGPNRRAHDQRIGEIFVGYASS